MTRRMVTALVLARVLLAACEARAATVVLVRSPHPTAIVSEATVRLRGELAAAGFEVQVVEAPPAEDIRASLEQAAEAPNVDAVVAIFGETAPDSAEVWVIDRLTGKTVVRRVPSEPESAHAAEVLSIRALEVLRASFLELQVTMSAERAPKVVARPPPPEVMRWTRAALGKDNGKDGGQDKHDAGHDAAAAAPAPTVDERRQAGWAVEVGGCLLGSLEGMTPSLLPILRVERATAGRFVARVTLAGLGMRARVDSAAGSAEVSQEFGLLEGLLRFRADKRLRPFLSAGAGALHVSADGAASFPYQGTGGDLWSLVVDAGAGVRAPLARRFELSIDLHAQAAWPYPVIQAFGGALAREGRPTLLGGLTLIAWL